MIHTCFFPPEKQSESIIIYYSLRIIALFFSSQRFNCMHIRWTNFASFGASLALKMIVVVAVSSIVVNKQYICIIWIDVERCTWGRWACLHVQIVQHTKMYNSILYFISWNVYTYKLLLYLYIGILSLLLLYTCVT